MFSAEVMTSKILIDEFQYEEDICLNLGPVTQKAKSILEDFTSIQTFQDGKTFIRNHLPHKSVSSHQRLRHMLDQAGKPGAGLSCSAVFPGMLEC